jgi:hypothetical protein
MRTLTPCLLALSLAAGAAAQDVVEPRSGVAFPAKLGDMSLLGVGLRTRTMLKVKVYAVGLYVADSALAGPLAAHKGKLGTPAFYRDLVSGDFPKQITMNFTRDLSASQVQDAFRETLAGAEASKVELFVRFFPDVKSGQQATIRWAGGSLETSVAGLGKSPIQDAAFAQRVFGIWIGDKPIQDDIKRDLASRAASLIP